LQMIGEFEERGGAALEGKGHDEIPERWGLSESKEKDQEKRLPSSLPGEEVLFGCGGGKGERGEKRTGNRRPEGGFSPF